ncbi:hypothetical protein TanjilG_25885 [Lupinus angustifolius]|uniref:Uncharacterized protein n=1 Tax=Lupinus angustifolius TaxID=3871 RepID=A0A1J7G2H0_LUPAN|nr:PREDICTED: uncharacterized protein LOC109331194 [Lupinus angustifolius]XP_019422196.1 PREDICTED: uncharacterized protein LOC109331883 [Lupinus angustifolius]OIV94659.1 hypothetical protein TanjilG_25883 [Lupinus angustifolius]OIV94661.1 hypothetical protein TanjilG_25885 [Lupinus angustifolius]
MKLSLKFNHGDEDSTQIMSAKVPISIFNYPFISAITSTTTTTNSPSDFSFSLSTNFPSAPSFKLSYSPTSTSSLPFSLSLKSGLGLFGSPRQSPLLFSVNFSLSPSSYNPVPTFSLHFKPQFGHFSLNKTVLSNPDTLPDPKSFPIDNNNNNGEIGNGFVADGSSSVWRELKLEPFVGRDRNSNTHEVNSDDGGNGSIPERSLVGINKEKCGLSPGVAVMARTHMPVTKGFMLNLRWGLNFPGNSGLKMPYLTVNKIGLERVSEEVKQNVDKQRLDASGTDLQLLKGMCSWMKRDLEIVEKENREMKRVLEDMKMGVSTRNHSHEGRKLSQHSGESSSKFEHWRSNKSGREENEHRQHKGECSSEFDSWRSKKSGREENGQKQPNKSQILASDVESELQKAIMAASS